MQRNDCDTKLVNCTELHLSSIFEVPPLLSSSFQVLYLNARSLRHKLNDVELIIDTLKSVDVIVITETWLYMDELKSYGLPGFQLLSTTREGGRGGGINIYINAKWSATLITNLARVHEFIEVDLICGSTEITIIGLYNPRTSNYVDCMSDLLPILEKSPNKTKYVVGDFNVNLRDGDSSTSTDLTATMESCGLYILNAELPTRLASDTLLDHIYTNSISSQEGVLYNVDWDGSDHQILLYRRPCKMVKNSITNAPITSINFPGLNDFLANATPSDASDPTIFLDHFLETFENGLRNNTETRSPKKSGQAPDFPWITKKYRDLCKRKDALFRQTKLYPENKEVEDDYKRIRNLVTSMKRSNKEQYFTSQLANNNNNPREVWKTINKIISNNGMSKSNNVSLRAENGNAVKNEKVSEVLNNYFVNIGKSLASKLPRPPGKTATINLMKKLRSFRPVNVAEVECIIDKLKNKNNPTEDGVTSKVLKKCKSSLSPFICKLINLSLSSGVVPVKLKTARVLPIPKKKGVSDISNFRPISILPALSKILEQVVRKRLLKFLEEIKFFSNKQYGFKAKTGTVNAAVDLVISLQCALDSNKLALGLYLDLAKAFDTVNHEVLLFKLEKAGIHGPALGWFNSYLSNRKQYVSTNGYQSNPQNIDIGVPQGSILGPILFLIYINDLAFLDLHGDIYLFADDTCLFYIGHDIEEIRRRCQNDISKLETWFHLNLLTVNSSKTVYMLLRKSSAVDPTDDLAIYFENTKLERVPRVTYLGLIMDEHLNWIDHVDYVKKKVSPAIGIFSRLCPVLNASQKKMVYHALVQCHLNYMNVIWASAADSKIKELQVLQNRAIKRLYGLPFRTHTEEVYRRSGFLDVQQNNLSAAATLLYKALNGLTLLNTRFSLNAEIHNYPTRSAGKIHQDKITSTKYGVKGVKNFLTSSYNKIPSSISSLANFNNFKVKLKHWLKPP